MELKINVEDYLDKEEIIEMIRYHLSYSIKKDTDRILSNASYGVMFEAVNKALDDKMKEIIKQKVLEHIQNFSDFYIFRKESIYGDKASVGQEIIDKAVIDNKDRIYERVDSAINSVNINEKLEDMINDSFEDILLTALRKGLGK